MESAVYAGDFRISYYDLDMRGSLKLSALMRMIHVAADVNAASFGVGYTDLSNLNMTFVLQKIGFKFLRTPRYSETVRIRTWPSEISKGTFLRLGDMYDADGNKLIEWASLWILFDLENRKILKPNKLPVNIPEMGCLGVEVMPEKIVLADDAKTPFSTHTHHVRYADVDTNIHMNNSIYGDLIGNAVFLAEANLKHPDFRKVYINYLSEARFGECIDISATDYEDAVIVAGESNKRKTFCAKLVKA